MKRLRVPEPISGGIFLSYKCNGECRHCMYACSPKWRGDWIALKDLQEVLDQLAGKIKRANLARFGRIDLNRGLHFTGGEPFLNFELLLKAVKMARDLEIPGTFVETNCFWCIDDDATREKLLQLNDAGLGGMLVSVNPFILEYVPFERTRRAVRIGREVFGDSTLVYQQFFYHQFESLDFRDKLSFDLYLQKANAGSLGHVELIPMGRAPYKLGRLFQRHPARDFFGESCTEELTRPWHVHVDNYCNYITGYCGGISLGDARGLDSICRDGIDLSQHPIIGALVADIRELYELASREFEYREPSEGYVSKCHLCVDVRRHIVRQTDGFTELQPKEFYANLR